MKICHFTPVAYPSIGGIETVVHLSASEMSALGHDIEVICLSRVDVTLGQQCQPDSAPYKKLHFNYFQLLLHPFLFSFLINRLNSYDVVHVHDPKIFVLSTILFIFVHKPVKVLTTHGGFWHHKRLEFIKKVYGNTFAKLLLRQYKKIYAISSKDYNSFKLITPCSEIVIAGNPVKMNPFSVDPYTHPRNLRTWLYWGRLSRNKNIHLLMQFVQYLSFHDSSVHLHIASSDYLPEDIASHQALHLGLVSIHSNASDKDIASLISQSSVFFLPSIYEGFGLSLVEAASSGLIPFYNNISPLNELFPCDVGLPLDLNNFHTALNQYRHFNNQISETSYHGLISRTISASEKYSAHFVIKALISDYVKFLC
jgi:alpha-1,3-mannosyltransferase